MDGVALAARKKVKAKIAGKVSGFKAAHGSRPRTENGHPVLYANIRSRFYSTRDFNSPDNFCYTRSASDPDLCSLKRPTARENDDMDSLLVDTLKPSLVASIDNIHQINNTSESMFLDQVSGELDLGNAVNTFKQELMGDGVVLGAQNSNNNSNNNSINNNSLANTCEPVEGIKSNLHGSRAVSKPKPPVPPKKNSTASDKPSTSEGIPLNLGTLSSESSPKLLPPISSNSKPSPKLPPKPAKKTSTIAPPEEESGHESRAASTATTVSKKSETFSTPATFVCTSGSEPLAREDAKSLLSPTGNCAVSAASVRVSFSFGKQTCGVEPYPVLPHSDDSDFASSVPIKQQQTHMVRAYEIVDEHGRQPEALPPPRLTASSSNQSSDGLAENSQNLGLLELPTSPSSNGHVARDRAIESKPSGSPVAKLAERKRHEKVQKEKGSKKLTKALSVQGIIPEAMEREIKRHSLPGYVQAVLDGSGPPLSNSAITAASESFASVPSSTGTSPLRSARTSSDLTPLVCDEDDGWDSDEFDSGSDAEVEDALDHSTSSVKVLDLDPAARKIYNIVHEILTTERAYVKRLYLLDKVFQERLLKEVKENQIVSEKVLREIFSNLSALYTFHSTILLPDLEKRVGVWLSDSRIGDIFKTVGHCLLLYTEFIRNFENSNSTLTYWLKKSPKFASVIEGLQRLPECENLTLQHHMLEPVQRVPRYKLLLQDYLKKLPADAPDRIEAEESLSIIAKAADHANSSMKENDKFKKLLDLQERISEGLNGDSIVTASRMFIKEGELTKLAARSGQSMTRTLLLFNDLLLCCTKIQTTGKLRVRQICDLAGLVIDESDSDLSHPNAFRIKSRQRVLDLIAPSADEKGDWIESIRSAVQELDEKRGSMLRMRLEEDVQNPQLPWATVGEAAPVWVKDEDVSMCMLCAVKFGLIYRKHHCRGCGRVTCDKCSNYRARLAYTGEIERVCFACQSKLCGERFEEKMIKRDSIRARTSNSLSDMTGELFWKPPGKGWSKEWFVLSDFVLYVSKRRQDVKAFVTVPVPGFELDRPNMGDEQDFPHPFCVRLHKQNLKHLTYLLASDSEQTMQRWEEHLRFAVNLEKRPEATEN